MKICFVTATMAGGGAERVIANLSNELVKRGHEVTILLTAEMCVEYELDSKIKVMQISERTASNNLARIKRVKTLRDYFKAHKDVNYISMPTDTNIFVIFASLFLGINLIVSERNNPESYSHKKVRDLAYLFIKKIVFQTSTASLCYSKRLQKKGKIIFNPVTPSLSEPYRGKRNNRIVAVGRLEPQKNHKLLIDAFAMFWKIHPEYELWIYGKGSLQEDLLKQINNLKIEENVHLAGFSKNVWSEVSDSAAYVLSSDYEGMPNSLLEAMSMGMPVISTDCPSGGSAFLIEQDKNGILVPVGDCEKLCQAMCKIVEDENFTNAIAKQAMQIREKLSIQEICNQWIAYIEKK